MMAMTFKPDVDATTSIARAKAASDEDPDVPMASASASDVFRRSSNEGSRRGSDSINGTNSKSCLHSGLSALIQAATTQLGQLDETETGNDENAATTISSSNPIDSSKHQLSTPRRYTPHGFHTSSSSGTGTYPYLDQSINGSLNTTPTLGPEAVVTMASSFSSAAEVRKRSFPEVLMTVLEDKTHANVITFLPDGKFFAVRRKEFAETTMKHFFSVTSFDDFLRKIHSWGFSRIDRGTSTSTSGAAYKKSPGTIEIFRHPMFVKGDWEKCSRICFGESPTEVRLSALPDRARIEYTLSDESTLTASKRRLSPSHVRIESESSTTTSRQRLSIENHENGDSSSPSSAMSPLLQAAICVASETQPTVCKSESADTQSSADTSTAGNHKAHYGEENNTAAKMEDDVRSLALAITTEKLNLKTADDEDRADDVSTPLVERAVENATHTIVTDAIETLLRDEGHTRETYLKHERELSRSSLPGVVPISKQLFSPRRLDAAAVTAAAVAAAQAAGLSIANAPTTKSQGGRHGVGKGRDPPAGAALTTAVLVDSENAKTTVRRRSPDPPASVLTPSNAAVVLASITTST